MTNSTEQQAVPVAQEQESALATAFYLLDALAGEGLSQTCEDGRTIEADDTVHALCSAFYMEPDVGWYRDLAAELASLPCKSGEGADEAWMNNPLSLDAGLPETREAELVAALDMLVTAAAEYQEAAQSHISDIRYDEDGNLAERDAELSVVALPIARAALNARGGA